MTREQAEAKAAKIVEAFHDGIPRHWTCVSLQLDIAEALMEAAGTPQKTRGQIVAEGMVGKCRNKRDYPGKWALRHPHDELRWVPINPAEAPYVREYIAAAIDSEIERARGEGLSLEQRQELHQKLMNLPCDSANYQGDDIRMAYRFGHRDARHAAAELVLTSGEGK